jgi:hypothetical protein
MKLSPIILALFLAACGAHRQADAVTREEDLEDSTRTIALQHITFACDCANWATEFDIKKYTNDSTDDIASHAVFIEPADSTLALADTLGYNGDLIRFTGRFYKEKNYPKGYNTEEPVDKAPVFRYTRYEVLKSNYREAIMIDSSATSQ